MNNFKSNCELKLKGLPDEGTRQFVKKRVLEAEKDLFQNDGLKAQFYFHNTKDEILRLRGEVWGGYKDQLAHRIRKIAAYHKADWLFMIFEAWQGDANDCVRPFESPNRKEVVHFHVETLKFYYRAVSDVRYARDKKVLLQIEFEKHEKNPETQGRFENVICEGYQ